MFLAAMLEAHPVLEGIAGLVHMLRDGAAGALAVATLTALEDPTVGLRIVPLKVVTGGLLLCGREDISQAFTQTFLFGSSTVDEEVVAEVSVAVLAAARYSIFASGSSVDLLDDILSADNSLNIIV